MALTPLKEAECEHQEHGGPRPFLMPLFTQRSVRESIGGCVS